MAELAAKVKEFERFEGYVHWTPKLLVRELKRFYKHFKTASSDSVQKNYPKLYKAFERNKGQCGWFKSWDDAVEAANVDKNLAHTFWSKEAYLSVLQAYFTENPDSTIKEFELANQDAYTAYKRHKEEWGLESNEKELIKLKLRTAKPAPSPKPPKEAKPKPRKPLPKITAEGKVWDAEKELQWLDTPRGAIRWNISIPPSVKKELLEFPEIREKVERKKLSTD